MSPLVVALLVIMLIALGIIILIYAGKRQARNLKQKISDYLHRITCETGIYNDFQKHLVHQVVIIDELDAKLLVINHKGSLTHNILDLKFINDVRVITEEQTLHMRTGNKPETIVTQIAVQLTEKDGSHKLLVLFDHIEHSIYQKDGYDKEARDLCEKIKRVHSSGHSL